MNVEIDRHAARGQLLGQAKGDAAGLTDQVKSLLLGGNGVAIDAHLIQPYYASRVAAAAGMKVTAEARDGEVELKAVLTAPDGIPALLNET